VGYALYRQRMQPSLTNHSSSIVIHVSQTKKDLDM